MFSWAVKVCGIDTKLKSEDIRGKLEIIGDAIESEMDKMCKKPRFEGVAGFLDPSLRIEFYVSPRLQRLEQLADPIARQCFEVIQACWFNRKAFDTTQIERIKALTEEFIGFLQSGKETKRVVNADTAISGSSNSGYRLNRPLAKILNRSSDELYEQKIAKLQAAVAVYSILLDESLDIGQRIRAAMDNRTQCNVVTASR